MLLTAKELNFDATVRDFRQGAQLSFDATARDFRQRAQL
jgi:hypothetical protein